MTTAYVTKRSKAKTFNAALLMLVVLASMIFSASPVCADEDTSVEPLALRGIMRTMGDDMKTITYAIAKEDWALVVETAPKIADHPQPPFSEKIRILAFAGTDVSQFKDFDGRTHASARMLGEVAARGDGHAVIDAFSILQKTCLACHQRFRKAFQEHFYSED